MPTDIAVWLDCDHCKEIVYPNFVVITIKNDKIKIEGECPQCRNHFKEEIKRG